MVLITFHQNGQEHVGLWSERRGLGLNLSTRFKRDGVHVADMCALIEQFPRLRQSLEEMTMRLEDETIAEDADFWFRREQVRWLAPIALPRKNILCVGRNYADHVKERAADIPEHVVVFTKPPTSVIGDGDSIKSFSELTNQLDYEGELAIIVGRKGRGIAKDEAMSYVFGYTIINDVTARDVQKNHGQFFLGKGFDTFCPMGPWIVTADAIRDAHQLRIRTRVNGELRQDATTEQLLFDLPTIIATMSKGMTLEPGDIIATGTPAGVGAGFQPPRFLHAGDVVTIEVEGIGVLTNAVEA